MPLPFNESTSGSTRPGDADGIDGTDGPTHVGCGKQPQRRAWPAQAALMRLPFLPFIARSRIPACLRALP
jgi:hypothetical protein